MDEEAGSRGTGLARRERAEALEPRIDRKRELGDALTNVAVEKALGDDFDPAMKKAIAAQLSPWVERFVRVADELIRVPGTDLHIGLDPILGFFFPGVGDAVTGAGSVALLFLALKERIPTIAIGRMVLNIAIDTLLGSVPILGDAFDVYFRANRRNLEIIERFRDDPKAEPSSLDKLLVYGGVGLVALGVAIPLVIGAIFGFSLGAIFGG